MKMWMATRDGMMLAYEHEEYMAKWRYLLSDRLHEYTIYRGGNRLAAIADLLKEMK